MKWHGFLVFDQLDVRYDIILGQDFLIPMEFNISYSNKTLTWHGCMVALKSADTTTFYLSDDYADNDNDNDAFITEIKPLKYEKVDIVFITEQQKHLSSEQWQQLLEALKGHEVLFDGKLGTYPGKKVYLDCKADMAPIHCKPFPIPKLHEKVFHDKCKHLCGEGVLEPCGATEHAYPTIIIPKKDGWVHWVSNFHKLNCLIWHKINPLPKISDMLTRHAGYKYFTKLDVSMQHYTFELNEETSNLCVIVIPFSKFRYKCLPMGICQYTEQCHLEVDDIL